jgi:hypothetical protein
MNNNIKFCSNCDKTGSNQMYKLVGNDKKDFQKGFIYPFEIKGDDKSICPYCSNKLTDTLITENDFDLIEDVSDSDRQFLEAMIELKKNDPIEYQLKISQFKANLKQQESRSDRIDQKDNNIPKCPTCGSTNLSKISNIGKAAKVGLFGIFGAGDLGKTWKCNNCGSKW